MFFLNVKLTFFVLSLGAFQFTIEIKTDGKLVFDEQSLDEGYDERIIKDSTEESIGMNKLLISEREIYDIDADEAIQWKDEETVQLDGDKEKRKQKQRQQRRRTTTMKPPEISREFGRLQCQNTVERRCRILFIESEFRLVCENINVLRCN
uniref:Cnidarian restricted protein n=1 Tax=Clytia hemisphaerica TaxID=252671 RepID=A0A7M5X724_9CNID|eukprot:TCONS_00048093-protein